MREHCYHEAAKPHTEKAELISAWGKGIEFKVHKFVYSIQYHNKK